MRFGVFFDGMYGTISIDDQYKEIVLGGVERTSVTRWSLMSAPPPVRTQAVSVFDDRQLGIGLPWTIVRRASAYAELDGKRRDNNLY